MPCISIFHLCLSILYLFGLLESPVLHSITNLLKELLILSLYFHYPKLSACKDKNQNVSKDMMNHVPTRVHTISQLDIILLLELTILLFSLPILLLELTIFLLSLPIFLLELTVFLLSLPISLLKLTIYLLQLIIFFRQLTIPFR